MHYPASMIMSTHDRYFLDHLAIIHIHHGGDEPFTCWTNDRDEGGAAHEAPHYPFTLG